MNTSGAPIVQEKLDHLRDQFEFWETLKDLVDQMIDLMLNLRQSGHPGGSRSKVHAFLTTLLCGEFHWDIRSPQHPLMDKFVLSAGHTVPLVYATMAVFAEAMRRKFKKSGQVKYLVPENRCVFPDDLLNLRRNGGLPGHAEMEGKTHFLKFNTGPSGHGSPAAAGIALALKMAGLNDNKVVVFEGEGGLTPGAVHETLNSAWSLGLSNLFFVVDWNDFGIDLHKVSDVVYGAPKDWFESHGWRVTGTEEGENFAAVSQELLELFCRENLQGVPSMAWTKTRKGRGYYKFDAASHGSPHAYNSELFWKCRREFSEKYGVAFAGQDKPAPESESARREQTWTNIQIALSVFDQKPELVDYVADRLVSIGESVRARASSLLLRENNNPLDDSSLFDIKTFPAEIFKKPGDKAPNRAGLAAFGSYINTECRKKFGRPLFVVSSADLSDSTSISGFAHDFGETKGWGWYDRTQNVTGTLLPQEITEFANAGICAGMASVNFSNEPEKKFVGFYTGMSTYGSFSYLKYGLMRLFSQLSQDCESKLGKILWVVGHSGPETADDSRTHFGIFAPAVTKLFPQGKIINCYPWEYNEVPVMLAAAFQTKVPIVAVHLTRPAISIPDREKLGIASHYEAAKGAYLIRNYRENLPRDGVVLVQGTITTQNMVSLLDEIDSEKLNVKIIAAVSFELFQMQPVQYQKSILSETEWASSMVVTNGSKESASPWIWCPINREYSLSADWDNRWRTGGTVDEVYEEAHLSAHFILEGIKRFVNEKKKRMERMKMERG